jgi:hypothetical protein
MSPGSADLGATLPGKRAVAEKESSCTCSKRPYSLDPCKTSYRLLTGPSVSDGVNKIRHSGKLAHEIELLLLGNCSSYNS